MTLARKIFFIAAAILVMAALAYFGLRGKADPAPKQARNQAQAIRSGLAQQKSVPISVLSNGYVTPLTTVEVRPQTQNIVREVHVREGQDVRVGQLLFTLDQRNDASGVERARAQVARDRADLGEAEATLRRNEDLLAKGFVSSAVVDTARSKVESLRGTLQADLAAVQSSNISLGNNRITASINGRIGAIAVHPGSLAQPSGAPMVTIAQIDPITVAFSVPERELAHIRASYPQGDAPVTAQLGNGEELRGKLIFIDNIADTQSGTIRMKAQFANADHKLWPGTYVNVRMVSRTLQDAVVIPAQAIVTGPVEKVVYIVQPDDTVRMQKIDVLVVENGQAAVTGVPAGARVVIEGSQNLRPGVKVRESRGAQDGGQEIAGSAKSAPK